MENDVSIVYGIYVGNNFFLHHYISWKIHLYQRCCEAILNQLEFILYFTNFCNYLAILLFSIHASQICTIVEFMYYSL